MAVQTRSLCHILRTCAGHPLSKQLANVADTAQRLQALLWIARLAGLLLLALVWWLTSAASVQTRATLFGYSLVIFAAVLVAMMFYIYRLRRAFKSERFQRQVANGLLGLDVYLRHLQEQVRGRPNHNALRTQGALLALHSCAEVLTQNDRRLAFLAYDKTNRSLRVLAHIGLTDESDDRVRRGLRFEEGLAGKAIRHPCEVWYVEDCGSSDARRQGYLHLGSGSGHGSMVCVGTQVSGSPVGVLCIDSAKKRGFSPDEREAIKLFASHIGIFFRKFPK